MGQALAGLQGSAGAGVPPGQKLPTGHGCSAAALTDPAGHPHPGGPLQLPLQAGVLLCGAASPKVPAGHWVAILPTQ